MWSCFPFLIFRVCHHPTLNLIMRHATLALFLTGLILLPAHAQEITHVDGLGSIYFPNSGAAEAQDDFIRGVLLLHSFEYWPAAEAFRAAQEKDPDFVMAYWGEAMTHNHPLWRAKNVNAASAILEKMPTGGTDREKGYVAAVRALYAKGESKTDQDLAYMESMKLLHESYPDDDEARALYALSMLGSLNGEREFATYMKAAATVAPVFQRNGNHPGGAHYLIHSFDDPIHAPLGLPAADAYAKIAPNAAHAQHMTSHIFVAMGMWERVISANTRATSVQDAVRAEGGNGPNVCGHYSSWLHYGRLMAGDFEEAVELMDACHARVAEGSPTQGEWSYFAGMRARHILDSQSYELTGRWEAEPPRIPNEQMMSRAGIGGGPYFSYIMTDAMADLKLGDGQLARSVLADNWGQFPGRVVQLTQLEGLVAIHRGELETGLSLLQDAADREDAIPFEFGPPRAVYPTHESLAHALLEAGHFTEATAVFRRAQDRTPMRPLASRPIRAAKEVGTYE